MLIHCILVQMNSGGDEPWMVGAWDEYSAVENWEGFQEDIDKARQRNKDCMVLVANLEVPDSWMRDQFLVTTTKATPVESHEA